MGEFFSLRRQALSLQTAFCPFAPLRELFRNPVAAKHRASFPESFSPAPPHPAAGW